MKSLSLCVFELDIGLLLSLDSDQNCSIGFAEFPACELQILVFLSFCNYMSLFLFCIQMYTISLDNPVNILIYSSCLNYCTNLLSELSVSGFFLLPSLLYSCSQTVLHCIPHTTYLHCYLPAHKLPMVACYPRIKCEVLGLCISQDQVWLHVKIDPK